MTLIIWNAVTELINRVSTVERCLAVKGLLNPELRVRNELNLIFGDEEERTNEHCDQADEDMSWMD